MIDKLNEIVDNTLGELNLQDVNIDEIVKDLSENSKFFAFRILIGSRLLEKVLLHKNQQQVQQTDQPVS